jgi:hypothetical protein
METITNTMHTALARRIMRRTYYAFVIHMATRPLVRYGVPLTLLVYIVTKLVFVAAVFANAKAVGFSNLPHFTYTTITHADYLTLSVSVGLCILFMGIARDAARALAQDRSAQFV